MDLNEHVLRQSLRQWKIQISLLCCQICIEKNVNHSKLLRHRGFCLCAHVFENITFCVGKPCGNVLLLNFAYGKDLDNALLSHAQSILLFWIVIIKHIFSFLFVLFGRRFSAY
jgi:hypothetical protein